MMIGNKNRYSRRRILQTAGTASAVGVSGLAGCLSGDSSKPGSAEEGAAEFDSIHVGLVEPFSGPYAFLGKAERDGALLAKKDLEEEFDLDIKITEADTETDPDVGVRRLERLVTRDEIDVATGGVSSAVAISMGQWASRNGVSYMAAGSHSDATTGEDCAPHMYRTTSSNTMLARTCGKAMTDYANSWALVYADYTWGHTARDVLKSTLEGNGIEVADEIAVPLGAEDYSRALGRVQESGAEGLANITAGADMTRLCRQFIDREMQDDFKMGGVLHEDEAFWGLGPEGAQHVGVWSTPWSPAAEVGRMPEFIDRVRDEYGTTAYSRHYTGYTSMDQLVRATLRAGSIRAEDIRGQLAGHEYDGLFESGEYWRECDNQNMKPTFAVKAKDASEMVDEDGERVWFEHVDTLDAEEATRTCDETGCDL